MITIKEKPKGGKGGKGRKGGKGSGRKPKKR